MSWKVISICAVICFGVLTLCLAVSCRTFRISRDRWSSTSGAFLKYDKLEHFVGSAMLYATLRVFGMEDVTALNIVLCAGLAWEVKDAFMPYEKYGWIGGDGFSSKDLMSDALGAYLLFLIF